MLDLLTGLVSKSLVLYDAASERYRLGEVIRQYARERRIAVGEGERLRDLHLAWYGERAPLYWLEYENLLAALDRYENQDQPLREGLSLVERLSGFWWGEGRVREGWKILERFLPHVNAGNDLRLQARYYLEMGRYALFLGKALRARELNERVVEVGRALGDDGIVAQGLLHLGGTLWGSVERPSRELIEESHRLFIKVGDELGGALAQLGMGQFLIGEGDGARARVVLEEALSFFHKQGPWGPGTVVQDHLAQLDLLEGKLQEAAHGYRSSLSERWSRKDRWGLPFSMSGLAHVLLAEKKWERGVILMGAAEHWGREFSTPLPIYPGECSNWGEEAREALGERAFTKLREEGEGMSLNEAVECALSIDGSLSS